MEGGVFYEHGHRMVATGIGVLVIGLAVWLQLRDPRTGALVSTQTYGGFGNLIALPLQHHLRQEGNTVFLDDSLEPDPGEGYWYLVRLAGDCVASSWETSPPAPTSGPVRARLRAASARGRP